MAGSPVLAGFRSSPGKYIFKGQARGLGCVAGGFLQAKVFVDPSPKARGFGLVCGFAVGVEVALVYFLGGCETVVSVVRVGGDPFEV